MYIQSSMVDRTYTLSPNQSSSCKNTHLSKKLFHVWYIHSIPFLFISQTPSPIYVYLLSTVAVCPHLQFSHSRLARTCSSKIYDIAQQKENPPWNVTLSNKERRRRLAAAAASNKVSAKLKRRGKIIKKLSHTHAQSHKAKEMCVTIFFVADTLTNTLSDDA